MSTEQEELIPVDEAARYLGVTPKRLTEFVAQGKLRGALGKGPDGLEVMYYRSEVLQLTEHLRGRARPTEADEWPEVIGE